MQMCVGYFYLFLIKIKILSTNFSKKYPVSIFVPILLAGVEFFHTHRRKITDS